ncbi:Porin [Rhodovastum atsumiense]|uniref:Porin n=1 Tax=Rhodovastum atsumiense TaxID=504468 RepID=A0A5M6IP50_9PROT|nr:porin [Rhodovastum atsumiense]KAA5610053.1 porin [Rhodovastum atsumiense]CAH2602952.1 Porin [Rhodovastum atsumiense]
MRTILLAGVAVLGVVPATLSPARAQLQTEYPYTPPAGTTPVATPGVGTAISNYTTNPPLTTSNATVRLAGRLGAIYAAVSDSGRNNPSLNGSKLANYQFYEYARLYPSFDAVAGNGLKYGAFLEIRADNPAAAGGAATGPSISASNNTRGALYYRRETGYFGTDTLGYLRYGATDQPTALFITGTMENFNSGGWNGDTSFFTGNTVPTWPFEDVGNLYTTTKVVYVSPKFSNLLDFGISYEPGTGGAGGATNGNCPVAQTGCDALSSSPTASDAARRRNTIDAVLRARTAIGQVGVAATLGTIQSGNIQYNGTTPPSVGPYDGLNVIDVGLQATYGGFAVGGHFLSGRVNGQWALVPSGGRDAVAYVAGASYAFGPAIVGVQFFNYQSAGAWTRQASGVARSRNEYGIATGGTLTVAPGVFVFLGYLYGHRHQAGVDLLTGATGVSSNNNTRAQAISLATQFRW